MATPSSYRRTSLKRLGRRLLEQPEEPPPSTGYSSTLLVFCQDLMDVQQNCTELGSELAHKCGETLLSTSQDHEDSHVVLDYNIGDGRPRKYEPVAEVREKARAMQQQYTSPRSLLDTTTAACIEQHPSKGHFNMGERSPVPDPIESREDIQEEIEHLNELMIMARDQEQALRDLMVISDDEMPPSKKERKTSKKSSKSKTKTKKSIVKESSAPETKTVATGNKARSTEDVSPAKKHSARKKTKESKLPSKKATIAVEENISTETPVVEERAPMDKAAHSSRVASPILEKSYEEEGTAQRAENIPETINVEVEGATYGRPIAVDDNTVANALDTASIHKSPTEMKQFLQKALATDTPTRPNVVNTKKKHQLVNSKKKGAALEARKHRMDAIIAMQQGGGTAAATTATTKSKGSTSTKRGMEPPAMQKGKYVDTQQQQLKNTSIRQSKKIPEQQQWGSDNEVSSRSRTTMASTGEEHLKELTRRIAEASKSIRKDASMSSPIPARSERTRSAMEGPREPASPYSSKSPSMKSRTQSPTKDSTVSTCDMKPAGHNKTRKSSRRQSRRQHNA